MSQLLIFILLVGFIEKGNKMEFQLQFWTETFVVTVYQGKDINKMNRVRMKCEEEAEQKEYEDYGFTVYGREPIVNRWTVIPWM